MRRFAKYWDTISNSGRFLRTRELIFGERSPFFAFLDFSDWLHSQEGKAHSISPKRMLERLFVYLSKHSQEEIQKIAAVLYADLCRFTGKSHVPEYLKAYIQKREFSSPKDYQGIPERQRRHLLSKIR